MVCVHNNRTTTFPCGEEWKAVQLIAKREIVTSQPLSSLRPTATTMLRRMSSQMTVQSPRLRKRSISYDSYLNTLKPRSGSFTGSSTTLNNLNYDSSSKSSDTETDDEEREEYENQNKGRKLSTKILPWQKTRKTGFIGLMPQVCTDIARYVGTKMSLKRRISSENDVKPLICAIRNRDINRVRQILETQSLNVDGKDAKGVTAMHEAAICGQCETIKLLLRYNAQINKKDNEGFTCVDYAVFGGHFDCAKFLIDSGAAVTNIRNGVPLSLG